MDESTESDIEMGKLPVPTSKTSSALPADRMGEGSDFGGIIIIFLSKILWVITFPIALLFSFKVVKEYSRAVVLRLGRFSSVTPPGLVCILPCTDDFYPIDLRVKTFDVPPQEVLSRDSVTVRVNAVVYYRINDPVLATMNVQDAHYSTRLLGQTTLRNVIGTQTLHNLIAKRDNISNNLRDIMDIATDPWGVKVDRVEIKDIILPSNLQRAMAAEAEAQREAKAKVVAADGEKRAAKSLREAAEEMEKSPAALQLRYLQTLNTIAAEKNSTIVFPLPVGPPGMGKGSGGGTLKRLEKLATTMLQGSDEDSDSDDDSESEGPKIQEVKNSKHKKK